MSSAAAQLDRFRFINDALTGSGGFRPAVTHNARGEASGVSGACYLTPHPRESNAKYARRCEVAWFENYLAPACSRFAGYLAANPPMRDFGGFALYQQMADDIDAQGNALDVFLHDFALHAKARGTMLALVDAPDAQSGRTVPLWKMIAPEAVRSFRLGDDGKFDFVEFSGTYAAGADTGSSTQEAIWRFDRQGWSVRQAGANHATDEAEHGLGECPVLIFTETGAFPCFGSFSQIADISRRLFNAWSELDEILRAQTFSLLTFQVPADNPQFDAAAVAETIGTHNMLVHSASTPQFIAPPNGPASLYLEVVGKLEARIRDISLNVEGSQSQESGLALQMRFRALNSALTHFARRMEDFERRAWALSARYLGMKGVPKVSWARNFELSDINAELEILQQLQAAAAPEEVVSAQFARVVSMQFASASPEDMTAMQTAIASRTHAAPAPEDGDGTHAD